jgi:hypothetical protein
MKMSANMDQFPAGCGVTVIPACTFWMPETMTISPWARPAVAFAEPEDIGALLVLQDGGGRHHRQLDALAGLHRHLHELTRH